MIAHVESLRSSIENSEDGRGNTDSTLRSIAIQSLLHIGSRSFSHLLNAIERYLPLLRNFATGGRGNEAKYDILSATASFWKYNRQLVGIVFDKLMQYQIVDPTDVVAWTFVYGSALGCFPSPASLTGFEWELIRAALDKANGRVMIARKKVAALRKEDDDTRGRVKASEGSSMEVEPEGRQGQH